MAACIRRNFLATQKAAHCIRFNSGHHLSIRNFSASNQHTDAKQPTYGVFITGGPPDHLQQFGDYGDMMVNMLSDPHNASNETWHKYYCLRNEFPSKQELQQLSGVVITGSRFDAHAQDEWMCTLRETITDLHRSKNKYDEYCRILGICFGHQIVSNALNGVSGPSSAGWQLGIQEVKFTEQFHAMFPFMNHTDSLPILKLHRDQVSKLPDDAVLLASSCSTPIEMYAIGETVLCVQGHPEFDMEYLEQVVAHRNEKGIIPDVNKDICVQSMREYSDTTKLKQWHQLLRAWLIHDASLLK